MTKKRRKKWISHYGREVLMKRHANGRFDGKFHPPYAISPRDRTRMETTYPVHWTGVCPAVGDGKFAWCSLGKNSRRIDSRQEPFGSKSRCTFCVESGRFTVELIASSDDEANKALVDELTRWIHYLLVSRKGRGSCPIKRALEMPAVPVESNPTSSHQSTSSLALST